MRIISTVPSQTELLYDLGLDDEVIGITKFCIHPVHWKHSKEIIGGTKTLHIDKIACLKPDWILSNKEENIKEQILDPLLANCQHYTSDVYDLDSALDMIKKIGMITQKTETSLQLIHEIQEAFSHLNKITPTRSCLYLIWKDPYMSVGGDTFIHQMLSLCGWQNVMATQQRYPTINWKDIQALAPQDILLSSEPYPFKEKHIEEIQYFLPEANVMLVDGTYFSWYGSRLRHSPQYFNQLLASLY